MLASTDQNKPLHFFRRFVEGWFSVYLSIFLATLAVRLLFFSPDSGTVGGTALAHPKFKTRHVLEKGFRGFHFYDTRTARVENATSFGASNKTN